MSIKPGFSFCSLPSASCLVFTQARSQVIQKGAIAVFLLLLTACEQPLLPTSSELESRFNTEQPALSGDGRFLAFVSNREGSRSIWLYDRREKRFIPLPRLNRRDAIAESPSLSYTGRYIAYLASDTARPEIELYDRATQQTQVITIGYRGWFRNPKLSPDGRYIAFESGTRGQWDIEVFDRGPNIELDIPDYQRTPATSPSPSP
jgi:Tol biopolymer transport system component